MKRLLLIALALLAAYMGRRAMKREAEIFQLLWALLGLVAITGTASNPKTRSVEQRLNTLVPVVFPNTGGTINGNVLVTGTHQVNGNAAVGGSLNATGQINGSTVSLSGGATVYGFTSHGGVSADGSVAAGGNVSAGGDVGVGGNLYGPSGGGSTLTVGSPTHFNGVGATIDGGLTGHGNASFDGSLHVSGVQIDPTQVTEGAAGSAGATYSQSYMQGVVNRVNQLLAVYG